MPQNKNKSRSNNKKKKNRSQATGISSNGYDGNPVQTSHAYHGNPSVLSLVTETIPNIEPFQTDTASNTATRSSCPVNTSSENIYVRYKKSTQRFKDELQSMVPSELFQSDSVASLMDAADYVVKQGMEVKRSFLADLKLSIRVRNKVACATYGGGDKGHLFFISALKYCWSVLLPLRKIAPPKENVRPVSISNRFANLFLSTDEDDETDPEDDLPNQPVLRPVEDALPKRLSLQELLSATDIIDCKLFLITLDDLMGFNSRHFSKLREISTNFQKTDDYPPSAIIEEMMEASVVTNSAIQLVSTLEQEFIHENPHLNTVYRFLARLILSELIEDLTKIVTLGSANASMFTEHHAIEFLGDCLECAFRNPKSDPHSKKSTLVDDFVIRWKLNDKDSIQNMFEGLILLVLLEVPIHQETVMHKEMLRCVRENVGIATSHNWLPHSFIGKGRSIVHTIRLLQGLSNIICDHEGRLDSKQGSFGPQWGGTLHKSATRIAVEMDELLLGDIMPSLINMCSEGLLSKDLPREQELLPIFCQIKLFVKYPQRPVTWSLAFSVHSILTAIFEIHNAYHFKFLADAAQQSFDCYFSQLEWVQQREVTHTKRQPPQWEVNLKNLLTMRMLTQVPIREFLSEKQIQRGVWNPLCAGTFLTYLSYFGNVEGGTAMVDSVAQLRVFLHLYNALIKMKAIKKGDVDLLDWLHEVFRNSKTIWEGPLPELGKFQFRWWISFGMKVAEAQRRCDVSVATFSSNPTKAVSHLRETYNRCRRMTPIEPESMSKSYRRLCMRDYHDVVDKKFEQKGTEIYAHVVRVNDTLDAIDADQRLLAINWIVLGFHLNQFYISMFNVWGWMPQIDRMIQEAPKHIKFDRRMDGRSVRSSHSWEASDENLKYQAMSSFFAERVLGALDRGDQDVARKCADLIKTFFGKIPPGNNMWFTIITRNARQP